MSAFLHHIAGQLLNRPLLVTPDKADVILAVLAGRIGIGVPEANRFEGEDLVRDANGRPVERKPYRVAGGVAIITITGSLVTRGAWIGANSGLTSYEAVQFQIKTAMADDAVKAVILDMHTPGGQAIGAFETAALVRELAAKKPTVAVVAGMAASAGYAIASGAGKIVTTQTGLSGSIGVVLLHADFSRQLAKDGVKPTLIFAGARKVDGNAFEPLSKEVRESLQAEVNAMHELFLKTVALGRGRRLDAEAARRTEARTFMGAAAVAAGLADRVGTFEEVLDELQGGKAPAGPVGSPAVGLSASSPVGTFLSPAISAMIDSALAAARAAPPAPVDPVRQARRAEYDGSPALRAVWPDFATYDTFMAAGEAAALARARR